MMNKDQIKGRIKEVEGSLQESAGKIAAKDSLEQKGKLQKIAGKAQAAFGDFKSDFKSAIKQDK
jgi:uncharacterized protein YjbJ (UPF0337 family)